jgi:HipA-like protein
MRKAAILYKQEVAGELWQNDEASFVFRYLDTWFDNPQKPAISLTLPKKQKEYTSEHLFPFFYNMLPEGSNKQVVCTQNRIDESDNFGLLLSVGATDTIGAVNILKSEEI